MTTAGVAAPAPTQDWTQAWTEALDALELDVARAESMLQAAQTAAEPVLWPDEHGWQPPTGLGPLPSGLLERARRIHARQLAATSALTLAMQGNRRQAAVAARLETGAAVPRAAFVDQRG